MTRRSVATFAWFGVVVNSSGTQDFRPYAFLAHIQCYSWYHINLSSQHQLHADWHSHDPDPTASALVDLVVVVAVVDLFPAAEDQYSCYSS